jgi:hypothetical protein
MTLRELTTRLQTLCHDGWSEHEVGIKVLDSFYKVGEVLKVTVGSNDDETDKIFFVIDTEVK